MLGSLAIKPGLNSLEDASARKYGDNTKHCNQLKKNKIKDSHYALKSTVEKEKVKKALRKQ